MDATLPAYLRNIDARVIVHDKERAALNLRYLKSALTRGSLEGGLICQDGTAPLTGERCHFLFEQFAYGWRFNDLSPLLCQVMWTNERLSAVFNALSLESPAPDVSQRILEVIATEDIDWVPCCEDRPAMWERVSAYLAKGES